MIVIELKKLVNHKKSRAIYFALDKTQKEWYNNTMKKFIDPKNPNTVGKSFLNLGNHILVICFILALLFVVKASYS